MDQKFGQQYQMPQASNVAMPPPGQLSSAQYPGQSQQQSQQPSYPIPPQFQPPQQQMVPQQQLTQQQQPQVPYSPYVTSLLAQMPSTGSNKTVLEDMPELTKSFDDAFSEAKKSELRKDFELVKNMTLLDDDEMMHDLLRNRAAFVTPQFKVALLSAYYKEKYPDLFAKYDSLCVYLEFVLCKIINSSEASLKSACASRAVRLPNSSGSSEFLKLFKRKRGAVISDESNLDKKKSKSIKHPFLLTSEYTSQPILFSIGKCCEYVVPSEFAELFAHIQYEIVTRLSTANRKDAVKGLKITFSKPIICLLVPKTVTTYTFISLEHLSSLGTILSDMTSLGKLDDTFAFGTKLSMQVENIMTNKIEAKTNDQKFDNGFYVTIITGMQVCKLFNKTLSSKTYSNVVYCIPENKLSNSELENCQLYIEKSEPEVDAVIAKYEQEVAEIDGESLNL